MATAKSTAKKATGGRKYSAAASESVEREMKAMKEGKLESGSGEKVRNPKQAIAIGLSEARRAGAEMPPAPGAKKAAAKKGVKGAAKKAAAKSVAEPAKKVAATPVKAAAKKTGAKKTPAKAK